MNYKVNRAKGDTVAQVTFYKSTGKYYAGGPVDFGTTAFHDIDLIKRLLLEKQEIVAIGWENQFHCVVSMIPDNALRRDYNLFPDRLYLLGSFEGITYTRNGKELVGLGIDKE